MKTVAFTIVLALTAALPAQAQLFRPETARGAVIGGIAGAVIGHNDGRHGWEGAAYGAAAGALIGTMVGDARDRADHRVTQVPRPVYRHPYPYRPGLVRYHDRGYIYRRPVAYPIPVYRYPVVYAPYHRPVVYSRPNYVHTGVLLGGIAGAIIGHNDGRHGWEGAAYGAGAGYLLGTLAQRQAERRERAIQAQAASVVPAAPSPQQVTIINHYYGGTATGPMSSANGLFGR